jgi:parallel beta-helix repeat protein
MTYTFKLARRTARLCSTRGSGSTALILAASLLGAGCQPDRATGPADLEENPSGTELAAATTPVPILPGQSIQAKVNSYPAGTRFLLKAGTHTRQTVSPKSGNWFIGEAGTILTGQSTTPYAFDGARGVRDVHIQGLIIEKYDSPVQMAPILANGTIGWVIEGNEIRYNSAGGVRIGDKARVLRNYIHHNHQIGIVGRGDSVLIEDNEIAYNNYLKEYAFGFELGGAKFVNTRNLVVRGNRVHHNEGNGLWTDMNNIYVVYENNIVDDNSGAGIFHEVSLDAKIRNNTTRRNGFARGWVTGAGILVSASANVEVYGNQVSGNKQGIVGIQQKRTINGIDFSKNLKNLYVHNNTVTLSGQGVNGVACDTGDNGVWTSRNNRFQANSYDLASYTSPFRWMSKNLTKSQWQGYGQDTNGSFY